MACLRTAMDATFWDFNISTTNTLHGMAKSIPGEPIPIDGSKASRALRIQQISFLSNGFPLGIIPAYSPITSHQKLGSFALQSVFYKVDTPNWWLGFVGQVRPKKLVCDIKEEIFNMDYRKKSNDIKKISTDLKKKLSNIDFKRISNIDLKRIYNIDVKKISKMDFKKLPKMGFKKVSLPNVAEWEVPILTDIGKHFLDKSLYALGVCSQLSLSPSTSMLLSAEKHGEKEGRRLRAMLFHKLPDHDILMEAAWPELFIDHKGKYWEVPESISLDCLSLVSEDGLRYRFGLHKNSGHPQAVDNITDEPPLSLMQGLCAKAAFSYEKSKDLWRIRENIKNRYIKTKEGRIYCPPYDVRLNEPHEAISGIIGGTFESWLSRGSSSSSDPRRPFAVDLFGSVCYSLQYGTFRDEFADLTRLDARLDVSSASALVKQVSKVFRRPSADNAREIPSSPRLEFIFQQQVVGPIVFRVDTRFSLGSSSGRPGVKLDDFVWSLNYSLKLLQSGKVVAWYSSKRKEGMVELRLFEF